MIIQKEIKDLIKDVAEKNDVSFDTAKDVVYSQFKYVRDEMESGDRDEPGSFKVIALRHLGTFYFSERKMDFLKKLKDSKDAKRNGTVQSGE